jgi:hypothetical protein
MFQHGLVKILLVYHLSNIGDSWETFLMRNGFAQADPTSNPLSNTSPNSDQPLVEIQFFNSINEPKFIDKTPLYKGSSCVFSPVPARSTEQVTVELKGNDPHVPVNDASVNVNVKYDIKKHCTRRKQPCTDLGFKNKKVSRLIFRKLRNIKDTHLISIDSIKINERLDHEVEEFLA